MLAAFYGVGFTELDMARGAIIPAVLGNSLVVGVGVLGGKVLSKIQISGTHTVHIVCHTFWNF